MKKVLAILILALSCHALMALDSRLNKADSLFNAGKFKEVIQISEKLAEEAETAGDTNTYMMALCLAGRSYFALGDEQKAIDYCFRCFNSCEKGRIFSVRKIPEIGSMCASLSSASKVYRESGEYDEAEQYLLRCIKIEKALYGETTLAIRYGNLADLYIDSGRYEDALSALQKARLYTRDNDNRVWCILGYSSGRCFEAMGDSLAAEKCFRDALDKFYHRNDLYDNLFAPNFLMKLAAYAMDHGNREESLEYYRAVAELNSSYYVNPSSCLEACRILAEQYKGEDDALSAKYAAIADSLAFYPHLKQLSDDIALYYVDFPKKEREQIIRNQHLRLSLVMSLLLLVIVALIAIISRYRNLKEIARIREEQNEALRKANEQKEQLLEISKAIADKRVRSEVSRIASEIGKDGDVKLTKRESEIAALIADGLLNKEIADHLNISVRTVEFHRNAIYRKLGINNAVELMNYLKEIKSDT